MADSAVQVRRVVSRLRARGLKVVEVSGWEHRGKGAMTARGRVEHHTAGGSGDTASLRVVTFGRAGLRNSLSRWYVSRSGTIYLVALGVSWHAGRGVKGTNATLSGTEAEHSGRSSEKWSAASLEAQAAISQEEAREFGFSTARVFDHKEHAPSRKVDRAGINPHSWRQRLDDDQEIDMSPDELREIVREEIDRAWYHDINGVTARTLLNQTHRAATEVRDGKIGSRNMDADQQGIRLGVRDLLRRAGAKVRHDPPDEHLL